MGRQRQWRPAAWLTAAEAVLDPGDPLATPLALLHAGMALKTMARTQRSLAEPASGMLLTAAGLLPPVSTSSAGGGAGAGGNTSIALRAQLALLDEPGRPPPHWAGPRGLPGARRAAAAAERVLLAERGLVPTDAVVDGLKMLAAWWDEIVSDATASSRLLAAAAECARVA